MWKQSLEVRRRFPVTANLAPAPALAAHTQEPRPAKTPLPRESSTASSKRAGLLEGGLLFPALVESVPAGRFFSEAAQTRSEKGIHDSMYVHRERSCISCNGRQRRTHEKCKNRQDAHKEQAKAAIRLLYPACIMGVELRTRTRSSRGRLRTRRAPSRTSSSAP